MVPARHRRGPTQGKLSRSDHFRPNGPVPSASSPAPAANAKTAREPDEVWEWDRERLGYLSCKMAMAMASFVAAPHHHGSHLAAGFPFSARAGRSVGRSGATISMRAQVDAQPELTSSVSRCFSSHSSPNSHTLALVLLCFVPFSRRRRRAIVTPGAVAEVGTGGPAAGGECGVVGNWYLHQPNNAWDFILISLGMVAK